MDTREPRRRIRNRIAIVVVLGLLVLLAGAPAPWAGARRFLESNATWQTECGACHVAYPPPLLPARSWQAIMSSLDKHFGSDASLDPAAAAEISAFLERNAGPDRGPTMSLRITDTPWFVRKHRKVAAAWGRPAIKTAANCPACHPSAADGHYDDDTVSVPR
jgi:hypothetical protein